MPSVSTHTNVVLFMVSFLLLASCGSSQTPPPPTASTRAPATPATADAPPRALTSVGQPQAATPARALEWRNQSTPGALEIAALGAALELRPELMVERLQAGGAFEPVPNLDLGSMKLVAACRQAISGCVRIDQRGLRPVPWTGMSCSSQCNQTCDKNQRLSGRFRFVVKSCDGATRYDGPVFELPKPN